MNTKETDGELYSIIKDEVVMKAVSYEQLFKRTKTLSFWELLNQMKSLTHVTCS